MYLRCDDALVDFNYQFIAQENRFCLLDRGSHSAVDCLFDKSMKSLSLRVNRHNSSSDPNMEKGFPVSWENRFPGSIAVVAIHSDISNRYWLSGKVRHNQCDMATQSDHGVFLVRPTLLRATRV